MSKSIFTYESPEKPSDCLYMISPSMLSKFFDYPRVWYDEEYLGNPRNFKGNTSTFIGTICHYIYRCVTEGSPVSRESINEDLISYIQNNPNPDVVTAEVLQDYPLVSKAVVNNYILPIGRSNVWDNIGTNIKCEFTVQGLVKATSAGGYYVGGTCDRLENDIVCDYKTVAKLPNKMAIPFGYKIQLLSYAYALTQEGYDINYIRIIYGVRPTKTLDARCVVVTEQITDEMWKLIDDTLLLVAETVDTVRQQPEMAYLLFKSYDLKGKK